MSDEQKDEIRTLMVRFWTDIQGLPWTDKAWFANQEQRQATQLHYVTATTNDVVAVIENNALKIAVEMLDKMMEAEPNRELADATNFLQGLVDKGGDNATTSSND